MFCSNCGNEVAEGQAVCLNCGFSLNKKSSQSPASSGPNWLNHESHNGKSRVLVFAVAWFLGIFGVHRFLLGDAKAGALYVLAFVTGLFLLGIPMLIAMAFLLFDLYKVLATDEDEFSTLWAPVEPKEE